MMFANFMVPFIHVLDLVVFVALHTQTHNMYANILIKIVPGFVASSGWLHPYHPLLALT